MDSITAQSMCGLLLILFFTVGALYGRFILGGQKEKLKECDVEWVINDNAEFGVKIGDQFFFMYKGRSIDYGPNTNRWWRPIFKREFGECCRPPDWKHKAGGVNYRIHGPKSNDWKPLDPTATPQTSQQGE